MKPRIYVNFTCFIVELKDARITDHGCESGLHFRKNINFEIEVSILNYNYQQKYDDVASKIFNAAKF